MKLIARFCEITIIAVLVTITMIAVHGFAFDQTESASPQHEIVSSTQLTDHRIEVFAMSSSLDDLQMELIQAYPDALEIDPCSSCSDSRPRRGSSQQ